MRLFVRSLQERPAGAALQWMLMPPEKGMAILAHIHYLRAIALPLLGMGKEEEGAVADQVIVGPWLDAAPFRCEHKKYMARQKTPPSYVAVLVWKLICVFHPIREPESLKKQN